MPIQYINPKRRCRPYTRRQPRQPKITTACEYCKQDFHPLPSEVAKGAGKYCSKQCAQLGRRRPFQERFWDYVDKSGECWIWTGSKVGGTRNLPYGKFTYAPIIGGAQITVQAHRLSWEFTSGPIPEGLCVLHKCDNPPCVKPDHLFLGTNQDNIEDKVDKNRQATWEQMKHRRTHKGSEHHHASLTESQVREIRERYANENVTQASLAMEYRVLQTTISGIVRRKTWKHVR